MISKTGIHATLALVHLAGLEKNEYAGAAVIAEAVGAPRNYLGKLLQQMAENGLLVSQKGYGGGFRLALDADRISLYDVVEPIDHVSKWQGCFLGRSSCNEKKPCGVHKRWSKIREDYLAFLRQTTIAEVADKQISVT